MYAKTDGGRADDKVGSGAAVWIYPDITTPRGFLRIRAADHATHMAAEWGAFFLVPHPAVIRAVQGSPSLRSCLPQQICLYIVTDSRISLNLLTGRSVARTQPAALFVAKAHDLSVWHSVFVHFLPREFNMEGDDEATSAMLLQRIGVAAWTRSLPH